MATAISSPVEVEEMTVEDGRAMLNAETLDKLGISRETFLDRLDRGHYSNMTDEGILRLIMLAPFGR